MTCNTRCQHSKKDKKYCKCSCHGKNHGTNSKKDENRKGGDHLGNIKVGDLVKIREDKTSIDKAHGRVCFVEDLLGRRFAMKREQEQVSLYAIDGEYVGDWFEDEFDHLGKSISVDDLKALIEKNKDKPGLINDFERVLGEIKNGN